MVLDPGERKRQLPEESPVEWNPIRQNLEENEDWCRDLVEHSHDLLCVHDLDGRFLAVNPVPARLLGYSVEEVLRTPMRNFIDPQFHDKFDIYLREVKSAGVARGMLAVRTRSGERRIWEYHNTLRTEGVEKPMVRGIGHDVTDRVRAEKALRTSGQRLRLAQEVARIGTFERNLQTGESNWSPEMEALYGLAPGEFPRSVEAFLELVHTEDRPLVARLLDQSMQGNTVEGEWRVVWPDGTVHWIAGRWRVFKNETGRPVRALGMDFDITTRKQTEAALRQSEERFRVALKHSPIAVFCQDRDLRYTWVYNPHPFAPGQ